MGYGCSFRSSFEKHPGLKKPQENTSFFLDLKPKKRGFFSRSPKKQGRFFRFFLFFLVVFYRKNKSGFFKPQQKQQKQERQLESERDLRYPRPKYMTN